VAGHARLALLQHLGNLAHGQLHALHQQQDAQPAWITDGTEDGEKWFHGGLFTRT
jgi:hypothetical protein